MSRIDTLIAELCPDGVKYKQVWQITTWDKRFNGVDRAKQPAINPHHYYLAKELQPVLAEQGDIKVLTTSQTSLYTAEDLVVESHIKDGEIIAIPWGGNAVVQYYKGRYITSDNRIAVVNTESIMTKFLFYVLKSREEEISSYYRGAGIKHPEMSKVLAMEIPVPPKEVQREIVRILDTFAGLTDALTLELDCRRQQYAYYRDRLLSRESLEAMDGKPVEMVKLGEACLIETGRLNAKAAIENGAYCFFTTAEEVSKIDAYRWDTEAILIAGNANVGSVKHFKGKFEAYQRTYVLTQFVSDIQPRYLYHFLEARLKEYLADKSNSAAMTYIVLSTLQGFPIPVPSLAAQQKVVDILDRFDALTTSLTDGLPAEIEARRQQYEYYRDRLLDFPRKTTGTE